MGSFSMGREVIAPPPQRIKLWMRNPTFLFAAACTRGVPERGGCIGIDAVEVRKNFSARRCALLVFCPDSRVNTLRRIASDKPLDSFSPLVGRCEYVIQ